MSDTNKTLVTLIRGIATIIKLTRAHTLVQGGADAIEHLERAAKALTVNEEDS